MHDIVLWIQTVLIPTVGPFGLFVVAFFDSSFLSVPEINDVLVVTSAAGNPATAWMYVLAATMGSLAGCTALWYIGRRGGDWCFLSLHRDRLRQRLTRPPPHARHHQRGADYREYASMHQRLLALPDLTSEHSRQFREPTT